MHYTRLVEKGEVGDAESKHRPGVWRLNRNGYVERWDSATKRNQFQHRFVMEQQLGRALRPGETIHHRNGVRSDNRPENLELWVTPQAAGQRVEDLVAWVIEQYPTFIRDALTPTSFAKP